MKRGNLGHLAVLIVILGVALPGWALGAERGACASDVQKFCKESGSDRAAVAKCLKKHSGDLSPSCQAQIGEIKQKLADFGEACRDDAAKLCEGTRPGGGRILRCLKEHASETSPACQAALEGA